MKQGFVYYLFIYSSHLETKNEILKMFIIKTYSLYVSFYWGMITDTFDMKKLC